MSIPETQRCARTTPTPTARLTVSLATAALLLSACQTPGGGASAPGQQASYAQSCVTGAILGAAAGAAFEILKGKRSGQTAGQAVRGNAGTLGKAAAAGCAIGLASTAIGRFMDAQQQQRHEEAMQRDAKRRALEQQQYAAVEKRYQAMPAATSQQRANRDAGLDKARAEWRARYQTPTVVDLGNGGTSTLQPELPAAPSQPQAQPAGGSAAPAAAGCVDYTVLVKTAAGNAKQLETWCPNNSGQMVRAEVRDAPAT